MRGISRFFAYGSMGLLLASAGGMRAESPSSSPSPAAQASAKEAKENQETKAASDKSAANQEATAGKEEKGAKNSSDKDAAAKDDKETAANKDAALSKDATAAAPTQIVISVPDQKLAVYQNGEIVKRFAISTSRFGVGDSYGSYRTPLGHLKVCEKIGSGLAQGAVFKKRVPTGEVLAPNAPGRDPIVTRIIALEGSEPTNVNARARGIYIHGSPVEKSLGKPSSYGCIRMRSIDVVEVYNTVSLGTPVTITQDHLPRPAEFNIITFLAARLNLPST